MSRRLLVDPLEERVLLSVSPVHADDMLVNQSIINSYFNENLSLDVAATISGQSLAVDNDGDFVVTWTRYEELFEVDPDTGDPVLDPITGLPTPIIDPDTGLPMTDANIYARYFTDEVQRIALPDAVAGNNVAGSFGSFALTYGGNEIQKLEITASYKPAFDPLDPYIGGIGFGFQEDISGSFNLGFDLDRNGVISGGETTTIIFDETPPLGVSGGQHLRNLADTIQTGLQGLGGELNDVVVEPINPHEYLIHFGAASMGRNQPELTVESSIFTTGFLPAVMVSTVHEPVVIANIPVSPNDPDSTAQAIEQHFAFETSDNILIGPVDFPPRDRIPDTNGLEGPYFSPQVLRTAVPEVSVTARGLTEFEIRFIGDAGKKDHPQLKVTAVEDDLGNSLMSSSQIEVVTLKESSPEFRVNPEEPDDPFTILPDVLDQTHPAVAMDSDGEFVIVWQSEVPNSQNFGSVSDIFARRFSPFGVVDPAEFVPGRMVPGVRAMAVPVSEDVQVLKFDATGIPPLSGPFQLRVGDDTTDTIHFDSNDLPGVAAAIETELIEAGYRGVTVAVLSSADPYRFQVTFGDESAGVDQPLIEYVADPVTPLAANVSATDASQDQFTFRVNDFTTNAQFQPDVGMDDAGNFVIAWANLGQDISYFNGIVAQRFNRHGARLGTEWLVNTEDTSIHFEPYVGVSSDGHFAVTWTETDDPNFLVQDPYFAGVNAEVYAPDGTVLLGQFAVGGAGNSTCAFDMNNNFIITREADIDLDSIGGDSMGVRAEMYELYDAAGAVSGAVIRDVFRANSASLVPDDTPTWPLWQWNAQVAIDADGDVVIVYDGFGPDVSETVSSSPTALFGQNTLQDYMAFQESLQEQININRNADLLLFFDPSFEYVPIDYYYSYHADYNNSSAFLHEPSGDVTATIEEILIRASALGATDGQLGRLRAILDGAAGLVRGDANGVMFSRWDAAAQPSDLNNLFSDSVANAHRDGTNTRYIIALDRDITGGDLTLRIIHPNRPGWEDVTFAAAINNNVLVPYDTADNIEEAIENAIRTGISWDDIGPSWYEGPVDVRYLYSSMFIGGDELTDREDTPWDLLWDDPFSPGFYYGIQPTDYVFEVTFQGEVHDTQMMMYVAPNGNNLTVTAVDEIQTLDFTVITDGWFSLSWYDNNFNLVTTADINFDSTNPATVANDIQTELDAAGFAGVQVAYTANTSFDFVVTFTGGSGGADQPYIYLDPPAGNTPALMGFMFSTETRPGHGDRAPYPEIMEHTTADSGTLQTQASIGIEPDGDFVIAWTQVEEFTSGHGMGTGVSAGNPSNQNVYFRSFDEDTDTAGPIVTDLIAPNGTSVDPGGTVQGPVQHIVLTFDEDMTWFDAETLTWALAEQELAEAAGQPIPANVRAILDSVTNPENYRLLHNGVEVVDGMVQVEFGMSMAAELADSYGLNPIPSNKWEAVFTLDGNGIEPGIAPLLQGLYTVEALAPATPQSGLRDRSGNPLGHTGFTFGGTNFSRDFIVVTGGTPDEDTPVTEDPPGTYGAHGRTHPETPGAVAVDADGDHVITWTAYDAALGHNRVYLRVYAANGLPAATSPFVFEVTPTGSSPEFAQDDQRFGAVATDADGDFIVTWTNFRDANGDGVNEEQDVYARRFSASGSPMDTPFRVNTYTDNVQKWSSVAMDVDGDFVITWSSYGQEGGTGQLGFGYGVYARRYDSFGVPLDDTEFRVNVAPDGNQQFPSVAVDADGDFVVTWTNNQGGISDDVYARAFGANGAPLSGEFLVNTTLEGNQRYSDVAMDLSGENFVITWSSSGAQDGDAFGVYARTFGHTPPGTVFPVSAELQVNTSTTGDQMFSSVAMNHQGNFLVTWSGRGDQVGQQDISEFGIFYQRFDLAGTPRGTETRANITTQGNQRWPSVGADGEGNFVLAWTGVGQPAGTTEVYKMISIDRLPVPDADGPLVTDVLMPNRTRVLDGDVLEPAAPGLGQLVVVFGENLSTVNGVLGLQSVVNPSNWVLERNGMEVLGGIAQITFGRNSMSRKYEAVLTLDGNGPDPGAPPLPSGDYILTVREEITDGSNALDADFDGVPGTDLAASDPEGYRHRFVIFASNDDEPVTGAGVNGRTFAESPGAVAVDADGDHVVAWTSYNSTLSRDRVFLRIYDANGGSAGTAPNDFAVTPVADALDFVLDDQRFASVAIDADGDFVVTWTNYRDTTGDGVRDQQDVYARRYYANGTPMGVAFRVNLYTDGNQKWSDVAMDTDGDFVITWASYGQEEATGLPGYGYGIYARRYDSLGLPRGGEFRVNVTTVGHQQFPSVAMDPNGDFMITWTSDQGGAGDDIVARAFKSDGTPMPFEDAIALPGSNPWEGPCGGEILVNVTTNGDQTYPDIAVDLPGDNYIITWSSSGQDGSGYGVYARAFSRRFTDPLSLLSETFDHGFIIARSAEIAVNTTTAGDQMFSSVAMDHQGHFVVSWSGRGEQPLQDDTSDFGVFYQRYFFSETVIGQTSIFNFGPIGGETRANLTTDGNQWLSSLGTDGEGNFVVVWTGVGSIPGTTNVYKMRSNSRVPVADDDGPLVTDVLLPDRTRLFDGNVLQPPVPGISELVFVFGENLSTVGGTEGLESVINPDNWVIELNGSQIVHGITSVTFQRNPISRKYEAVLTLDGNGMNVGSPALPVGEYVLTVRDEITDGVNALDADFDGVPGTNLIVSGLGGYRFAFVVAATPQHGSEFRVNESTSYFQTFTEVLGTGMGAEESNRSVAVDHDGDFVVVWTSYGQDDPNDPVGGGVYYRMFDRDNVPLTPELRANTTVAGHQRDAEVAIDADGEFVIVWESEAGGTDGSYDVFGRRFDSVGSPVGTEFRVNTDTARDQVNPAVAMDNYGNFVVVFTTTALPLSFHNDIHAQLYDFAGRPVGEEFLINDIDIPSTFGKQTNPAVAMDADGDFVVAWDQRIAQTNEIDIDTFIYARMFDRMGRPALNQVQAYRLADPILATTASFVVNSDVTLDPPEGGEFIANPQHNERQDPVNTIGPSDTRTSARNPQVAIDPDGNFTIIWEAFQDNDIDDDTNATGDAGGSDPEDWPDSYGIFFHRFTAAGLPETAIDYAANYVFTVPYGSRIPDPNFAYSQVNPSVGVDANNNLAVIWNGNGAQPDPMYTGSQTLLSEHDFDGIFTRQYDMTTTSRTTQQRVNRTVAGVQQFPSLAMEPDGDRIVVWSGSGVGDQHGIFARRYEEPWDVVGAIATELRLTDGTLLYDGVQSPGNLQQIAVVFDEAMSTFGGATGEFSVTNPDNWYLVDSGGRIVEGAIASVSFGLNTANNKWEAVITFSQPLSSGYYELAPSIELEDVAGNKLRHTGVHPGSRSSELDNVFADRLRRTVLPLVVGAASPPGSGVEFLVNQSPQFVQDFARVFDTGSAQEESTRSVAMDHDGDFVVVWASYGQDDPSDPNGAGVFFRLFDRNNEPLTNEIRVNTTTAGDQWNPAVAMDADGDFAIVWQSDGQDPDGTSGIYARRYSSVGQPLDAQEFRVNTEYVGEQFNPTIAMDDAGDFVIVWGTSGQPFSYFNDLHAQLYDVTGQPRRLEFQVNVNNIPGPPGGAVEMNPAVAMAPNGDFMIAWDRLTEENTGEPTDTQVVATMYDSAGNVKSDPAGAALQEFQVNVSDDQFASFADHNPKVPAAGAGDQGGTTYIHDHVRTARNPQVIADDAGNYIVVWESFQDNDFETDNDLVPDSYGIYFRPIAADGTPLSAADQQANLVVTWPEGPAPGYPSNLFAWDQVNPSLAVDADGDLAVVWNGNGAEAFYGGYVGRSDGDGVWITHFAAASYGTVITPPNQTEYQTMVNRTTYGVQRFPSIAMDRSGNHIVVWSGSGVGDEHGIFARRYDEPTDTAGPLMTELRLPDGTLVVPDDYLQDPTIPSPRSLVVVFDEELMHLPAGQAWGSVAGQNPDVVENPANWRLERSGVEVFDRIQLITFGLNPATNKWEAVVQFDRALAAGGYRLTALHPIRDNPGTPQIEGQSGLRDAVGNPIGHTGLASGGVDFSKDFIVGRGGDDTSVTNGRTYPESRNAVGVDADGDHVVVITATDPATNLDRVYVRMYDADGSPAATQPFLAPVTTESEFADDEQRHAAVAADADGDFVVTWTNYRDEDGLAGNGREQQDVYARRFNSAGDPLGEAFRVNTYADHNQKWPNIAIDDDGDFIITWSSYGQEDNGQLGSGYGVYARRFESYGVPVGSEFRVNVTRGGDQKFSSVDINGEGGFVVAWTSDQSGVGDDIIARVFSADGSPRIGPLGGEIVINATTAGNQRYPDVAVTPNGNNFVVTWTSSGQDGSGDGVFARMVDIPLWEQTGAAPIVMPPYVKVDGQAFSFGNSIYSQIDVPFTFPDNFLIADVNVIVNILHPITGDVKINLRSPSGTTIELLSNVPYPLHYPVLPSSDFDTTLLDDEAPIPIDVFPPAIGPYNDPLGYRPEEALSAFDGQTSSGTWQLFVQDEIEWGGIPDDGVLVSWQLILERVPPIFPANSDLLVSTSTAGNQGASSVAMNRQGGFTVSWTGRGDQRFQEDQSGTGVFYQRFGFNGQKIGGEVRVNADPAGVQRTSSIGSDGEGNFVVVWTGEVKDSQGNIMPGVTDVYRFISTDFATVNDVDGPMLTDVWIPNDPSGMDRTRLLSNDAVVSDPSSPITELIVAFGEDLSTREIDFNGDGIFEGPGPDSVLNPDNWIFSRNGSEIPGAVSEVTFGFNGATRKYEARLTLSEAILTAVNGQLTLPPGNYTLVASELINDAYRYDPSADPAVDTDNAFYGGNALDGDFDGSPGVAPSGTGQPGYELQFVVIDPQALGAEFPINQSTPEEQRFAPSRGIGYAREESTRSVAVDHDGDFVVVWTSYDQDDGEGADVYYRLFDRDERPLTEERRANLELTGDQWTSAVAMDADGEFVIVWQSEGQDPDGSAGIYGRRFSSVGTPLGGEFRINSDTTGDQFHPAVAMDNRGNFVVVWGTAGQTLSYSNDVFGQRYDFEGARLGSQFQVNEFNNAGAAGWEVNTAVAMDPGGNFVVAWDQIVQQQNGVVTDSQVAARLFDNQAVPAGGQFQADSGIGAGGGDTDRTARNPQVAMDDSGNFIVVWESHTGLTYDVFYQAFDAIGAATNSAQVNQVEVDYNGHQVNPSVAVDADGDFAVVWNGAGAQPNELYDPANPSTDEFVDFDSSGVFIRHAHAAQDFSTVQTRVNRTEGGIQEFPSIAMEPDGDRIVVWSGSGVGDRHGIFARRYNDPSDNVGPQVTDFLYADGRRLPANAQVATPLYSIIVTFDEDMMKTGADSVTNPANYRLVHDGVGLSGGVRSVQYGLDPRTNKWSAELTLDGNGAGPGTPPLADGNFEIIVSNSLRDVVGNPLGSTPLAPNGTAFSQTINVTAPTGSEIRVNTNPDGPQGIFFGDLPAEAKPNSPQAVASDADGDYVAVFVDDAPGREGVYAKLYNVTWTGTAGNRQIAGITEKQVLVTNDPTAEYASVDRDIDGDFVVTWSALDAQTGWDVYARRFDADGNPLTAAFRVNSETEDAQRFSSVAIDADGDFVVVWQSFGQDGSGYGIYAQRYNAASEPIGGYNEVQVLSFLDHPVGTFKLGFEGRVTGAIRYDGNAFDIAGEIEAKLGAIGVDVQVAAISLTNIAVRFVGAAGLQDREELIVVNPVLTGTPTPRITVTTQADGVAGEFRVNDWVDNNQQFPSIDMGAEGEFIVTWTSFGQDGDAPSESNVYAKQFVGNRVFQQSDGEFGTRRYAQDSVSQLFPDVQYGISTDDPANHLVPPGAGYDGVVEIVGMGSGLLLRTGRHILTAAHVVDAGGGVPLPFVDVAFDLPGGRTTMTATQIFIHPDWNGDMFNGGDLAIIVLPRMAPQAAERYDIHRGGDELGHEIELVGYGAQGQGFEQPPFDYLKRVEYNVFEVMGEAYDGLSFGDFGFPAMGIMDIPPGTLLSYDFDSGLPANDTFGVLFGINDLGLGIREGSGAHGDSGGGAFLNGKIIGVTSGGIEYRNTDVDAINLNVSFGVTAFYTRVSYYADWIDLLTEVGGSEFLVNTTTAGNQKWSSVAMDLQGDFVVTWTSYGQDGVGSGSGPGTGGEEGVYAQRYDRATGPSGAEFQVNTTADKQQQASRAAMDADGDFVITWESFQDRPQSAGDDEPSSFGIYAQRYARNELIGPDPSLGANGEIGGELSINSTTAGEQRFPAVSLSDTGDYVIVWSGSGQGDAQGVFHQRFNKPDDEAGPTAGDVLNVAQLGGKPYLERVLDKAVLDPGVTQFVVTFSENLSTAGGAGGVHSVLNPANWKLTRDGQEIYGGIASIEFGQSNNIPGLTNTLNAKYQAVLTFDADRNVPGNQPLERGRYLLTVRDTVEDLFGNALDGDFDGLPDRDFDRTFSILLGTPIPPGPGAPDPDELEPPVNSYTSPLQPNPSPGEQESPATASNAAGDYVIVWTSSGQAADLPGERNIVGQRFNRYGDPVGAEFLVASHMQGSQIEPAVAMDDFGNFVVAWSGQGEIDDSGVFARVFDAFGVAQGDQFRVNQYRESVQSEPSLAMDADGEFVISWTSYGQDGDRDGVFARRYHLNGRPLTNEFQVNTTWIDRQDNSDVAMDADGDFTVVWSSDGQDGSAWGIYGQRFNANGTKAGSEFRINVRVTDKQVDPRVAMDVDGDFVVTWSSFLQDGSGYGIYARRFNAAGVPQDGTEFLVNQTTAQWQVTPDVGISDGGDFVITWSTFDQDDDVLRDYGIYARMFNANGSDYVDSTGAALGEFLVNITTEGDQLTPAIAVDSDGNYVIAWVGPDSDATGIFQRVVGVDPANYRLNSGGQGPVSTKWPITPSGFAAVSSSGDPNILTVSGTPGNDTFEFVGGATPGSWVVKLNGVPQDVAASVLALRFDGGGGEDSVVLTGTGGDETVELWPNRGVLSFNNYTVTVNDVDSILVEGRGGNDSATFHDSAGDDNFAAGPGGASMSGPGSFNKVRDFETVVALAEAGGYNVAKFYDSPADDYFVAAPRYGKLYGPGFTMEARTFNEVHAYATAGGLDVAKVYDSPGNDHFGATPIEASLFGDGYYNRIKFFEAVHAYANAGGIDEAKLTDSPGNDKLFASPVEASLYGDGFYNRAKNFDAVFAYAVNGGIDEGKMFDSAGNDKLVTSPTYAALYGDGFYNRAMHFDGIHASATGGGIDEAKMFDSPGNDQYVSTPTYGALYGTGFYNRAMHFDGVHAYATAGGVDEARMFDSPGDDKFYAAPDEGALYRPGYFYNRAKYFEGVHAYATAGGNDVANMYDSGEDDKYVGLPDSSAMYRPGVYYNRAKGFEEVHAHATKGGTDKATLYDAVLGDSASAEPPPGEGSTRIAWLYEFEECFTASQSSDDEPVPQAVDDVFKAYWQ